jgi:hypothetical protein
MCGHFPTDQRLMNGARNAHADRAAASTGLASWYVPGHADGFGDRLLMFDNTSTPSLELLRFHRDLSASPGFEEALRERVRRLNAFHHSAFSSVRAVQYLDDGAALALVSVHAQGQRLSELFEQRPRKGLSPAIVTWLLRELTPALAALQEESEDVAHGALTPDRIVLTSEGRLCIVEHVLGSALLSLNRAPVTLWRDFSIFAPADANGMARLDAATDVAQLAAVALSMLLARPVTLQEFQLRLPALLDEFSEAASTPAVAHHVSPLRHWLERALQVSGSGYRSALDAEYDVRQLPSHEHGTVAISPRRLQLPIAPPLSPPAAETTIASEPLSRPILRNVPKPEESRLAAPDREPLEAFPSESTPPTATTPVTVLPPVEATAPRSTPARAAVVQERPAAPSPPASAVTHTPANPGSAERGRSWLVVAMALAIVAQTAVIALLVTRPVPAATSAVVIESSQPGDTVIVNGRTVGRTPLPLTVGTDTKSVLVKSSAAPGVALSGNIDTETPAGKRETAKGTTAFAPNRPNFGGVRLISPLELKVFEGNKALGSSSDGPIVLSPGVHKLDVVNAQVGYRSPQTVTIKPGDTVVVKLTPPDGLVSVNAQPWANCALDRREIGETPLANLKVALGEHELVCRNPKLGEQRRTILVKADEVVRIGLKFDQ